MNFPKSPILKIKQKPYFSWSSLYISTFEREMLEHFTAQGNIIPFYPNQFKTRNLELLEKD